MMNYDNSINQKLSRFEESIMKNIEERCSEILTEVEDFREKELDKYANAIKNGGETDVSDEISALFAESKKNLSEKRIELKKMLFEKRSTYVNELFTDVEKNILTFTKSPEYKDFMLSKVKNIAPYCKNGIGVIKLRPQDIGLSDDIKKICGEGCRVEPDESIKLGGAVLINETEAVIIDESLDTILERQKKSFYENSGFCVTF